MPLHNGIEHYFFDPGRQHNLYFNASAPTPLINRENSIVLG